MPLTLTLTNRKQQLLVESAAFHNKKDILSESQRPIKHYEYSAPKSETFGLTMHPGSFRKKLCRDNWWFTAVDSIKNIY